MLTSQEIQDSLNLSGVYSHALVGPQKLLAAEAMRKAQEKHDAWPYTHIFGPPNSTRRDPLGFQFAPAAGTQIQVLEFDVPSGFWFIMTDLLLCSVAANQAPSGTVGDFIFTVDKNTPIGVAAIQSSPLADWNAIPFNIGSLLYGPWHLSRAELFAPEDQIRAKCLNVALGAGSPNALVAMFGGWLLPVEKRR